MIELFIRFLSKKFMRLPWVQDCMAWAWYEGKHAERAGDARENPYLR